MKTGQRGYMVQKRLKSLSWTAAQERDERKYLPELSLKAGNINIGGGNLAIGPQPPRQGSYS